MPSKSGFAEQTQGCTCFTYGNLMRIGFFYIENKLGRVFIITENHLNTWKLGNRAER